MEDLTDQGAGWDKIESRKRVNGMGNGNRNENEDKGSRVCNISRDGICDSLPKLLPYSVSSFHLSLI